MEIDKLTIGEAKQLASMFQQPQQPNSLSTFGVGKKCIIRTYSAGVFFGTVAARSGQEVLLKDSRRIWSWSGSFTLSAVSQAGFKSAKVSQVEPEKLALEVIEVIPCAEAASVIIEGAKTHEP